MPRAASPVGKKGHPQESRRRYARWSFNGVPRRRGCNASKKLSEQFVWPEPDPKPARPTYNPDDAFQLSRQLQDKYNYDLAIANQRREYFLRNDPFLVALDVGGGVILTAVDLFLIGPGVPELTLGRASWRAIGQSDIVPLPHPLWTRGELFNRAQSKRWANQIVAQNDSNFLIEFGGINAYNMAGSGFTPADFGLQSNATRAIPSVTSFADELGVSAVAARRHLNRAVPGSGGQSHHVITWEARSHELVQRAAQGGFNINGANNGIRLPLTQHLGSHGKYNAAIQSKLDSILRANPNISNVDAAAAVQSYADQLRVGLKRSSNKLR